MTSSSRVRSSSLRSRSVVVGADQTLPEVGAEALEPRSLLGAERARTLLLAAGELGLGGGQLAQTFLPFALQSLALLSGFRAPRLGNTARPARPRNGRARGQAAIARARHRGRPPAAQRPATHRRLQAGGVERREKGLGHGRIELNPADVQAVEAAAVDHLLARTVVAGGGMASAVVGVRNRRPQWPQVANPCNRAAPSLTAPPAWWGRGRVFWARRLWLAS